jgi:hypothetical protein
MSHTVKLTFRYLIDSMLIPIVGTVVTSSPMLILYKIVVFPAFPTPIFYFFIKNTIANTVKSDIFRHNISRKKEG